MHPHQSSDPTEGVSLQDYIKQIAPGLHNGGHKVLETTPDRTKSLTEEINEVGEEFDVRAICSEDIRASGLVLVLSKHPTSKPEQDIFAFGTLGEQPCQITNS